MLAFAFNSILCRMALKDGAIDPASLTSIRLLSGAVALLLIVQLTSKETNALISTCSNFVYSIAFVVVLTAITYSSANMTNRGILLAVISGAITSGVGYVIWYVALNYLRAMQAALVQLSVPAIAAVGGVMLLAESISLRLLISGALILGGISLALVQKSHRVTDS